VTKRAALLLGVAVVLVAVAIVLLVSGGAEAPSTFDDASGDVSIGNGTNPPKNPDLADVVSADVRREGDALVFHARMDRAIPKRVENGSLTWRWDVYENGTGTWILSADLDLGANASLASTQTDYGSGTIDDTLPGDIEVEGDSLTITVRPAEVDGFPSDFTWTLGTSLDGDRGNPTSAQASDAVPDQGRGRLEE
jgi:hypothetical protein